MFYMLHSCLVTVGLGGRVDGWGQVAPLGGQKRQEVPDRDRRTMVVLFQGGDSSYLRNGKPMVWWVLPVLFCHMLCFLTSSFVTLGKLAKAGNTVQPARMGLEKAGSTGQPPSWSLPCWARLVKAGRAGGHLAGLPAWSPHSSTGERVAAQQASPAILPESKLVAPQHTFQRSPRCLSCPVLPRCGQCISEHSAHSHTHTCTTQTEHANIVFKTFTRGQTHTKPTYIPKLSTG